MVVEVAVLDILAGQEDDFVSAYEQGHQVLAGTPGCRSVRMTRGVETPTRFVLIVEWDSVQAHVRNFRETERFSVWRGLIGPYFATPPLVEHYIDVPAGVTPDPAHPRARPGQEQETGLGHPA